MWDCAENIGQKGILEMTKFEAIKNMTIEEMARERIRSMSRLVCRSNADNMDFYDYWYETSDKKRFSYTSSGEKEAIAHEIEILNS